jgi:cytidylate kinase
MYFITVSEMLGTKGQEIAAKVAEKLNYTYFGEGELLKAAGEMGFLSEVQKVGEKSPPLLEKFFTEKPRVYLDRLQAVIYEVAKKGDAVFFGRGSQLLLHSFDCAFHALITGSLEKRIERIAKEMRVGKEMAEKIVHQSDRDKRGFFRFAFGEDWLNPQIYDLLLNTDKLSVDSAVKMIIDAAKSEEIKACGIDSVKSLGKLSLQRKVEAAFLEAGVENPYLFFDVEEIDSVRLYGLVTSPEEKETIEKIVKRIQGVKNISNELTFTRASMGGV